MWTAWRQVATSLHSPPLALFTGGGRCASWLSPGNRPHGMAGRAVTQLNARAGRVSYVPAITPTGRVRPPAWHFPPTAPSRSVRTLPLLDAAGAPPG
jgi:hypothetical protein